MKDNMNLRAQLWILRSLQFASFATMALVVAFFPLYFDSLGFSKQQIGAIYSIGPVLSIFSNLLAGFVSDKTKNVRRVLNLLFVGQILALALLLPQKEFGLVAGVMALFYLFQTPVNSMLDSVSLLAAERMQISFPSIRVFGSLGYAVSAVAFGYLLKVSDSTLTLKIGLATTACALLFSILLGNFQASVKKFEFGGLWALFRRREVVLFFLFIAFVSISHRMNEGFLSVAMRDNGASDFLIGTASLASAVSEMPIFFLLAKYGQRFKELPLLAIASIMYVVRLSLLSFADEPWMFVALQMMHSVTFGIFYITALRYLLTLVPDEYRSSGQALFTVVWSGIAGLVAGLLGGWLYDSAGLSFVYRIGACTALVSAIGFLYSHISPSRRADRG
ncbi:MFS transporter [Cohnella faecalis]|uniref:MFS transporter n=1 Tax=Cohnella faecalis TaxID=2315694 RepID=A0A398CI96_9BACL|nr:MFS transporter [Cohnella faecalis]RIE00558.1 MFS transporter [Cohnella faecalis]